MSNVSSAFALIHKSKTLSKLELNLEVLVLGAGKRTNNKLNPHMTSGPGIEPGAHWWEVSALTIAPSLLLANAS